MDWKLNGKKSDFRVRRVCRNRATVFARASLTLSGARTVQAVSLDVVSDTARVSAVDQCVG